MPLELLNKVNPVYQKFPSIIVKNLLCKSVNSSYRTNLFLAKIWRCIIFLSWWGKRSQLLLSVIEQGLRFTLDGPTKFFHCFCCGTKSIIWMEIVVPHTGLDLVDWSRGKREITRRSLQPLVKISGAHGLVPSWLIHAHKRLNIGHKRVTRILRGQKVCNWWSLNLHNS